MKATKQNASRRLLKILRILRARPKLIISVLLGTGAAAALPSAWPLAARALVGWDIGVALYLAIIYWTMARSWADHIRQHAKNEDEGRGVILVLTVAAAMATIVAIVAQLGGASLSKNIPPAQLFLAVTTILLSWTLIHSIFAVHYAYEFYSEGRSAGGLQFPGDEKPDYWDFVYFSFVVGMTFQVSDVAVSSRRIRRTVIAHGIVSFLFNVTLVALMVNIAATALQ